MTMWWIATAIPEVWVSGAAGESLLSDPPDVQGRKRFRGGSAKNRVGGRRGL
jgi:hypothetical protein